MGAVPYGFNYGIDLGVVGKVDRVPEGIDFFLLDLVGPPHYVAQRDAVQTHFKGNIVALHYNHGVKTAYV